MELSNNTTAAPKKPSFGNQLIQHIQRKWHKKIGKIQEVPWMDQKEQDILEEAIATLKPRKCLEWGSGFSTLTFPHLLPEQSTWLSIEHNEAWHQVITAKQPLANVTLTFIGEDNKPPYSETDGGYDDFKSYVEYPKDQYDFILIDGRARNHCLKKAHQLLTSNGLVMMHDANRSNYQLNTYMYHHQYLFTDHRKTYGGIWLGSKETPIESFINIKTHQNLWNKHYNLLRIIRPFARR